MRIINLAYYKFVNLTELATLRKTFREKCLGLELKGTILLAAEGINCFLAGSEESITEFKNFLTSQPSFSDAAFKESITDYQPFTRMLVKIKKEIIAFGENLVDPAKFTGPTISAKEFKRWLDEKKDVVVLDTRNDYEVKIGTFEGAIDMNLKTFRQFPEKAKELAETLKDKTIVSFCTGGIRCEKASPLLINYGFKNVLQLEGGILRYFEECGDAHFNGECFVFDHRVAVNGKLEETNAVLCYNCQMPVTAKEQELASYVDGTSCLHCVDGKPKHKEKIAEEIRKHRDSAAHV